MSQLYAAYRFRDKDPVIDELRTLLENEAGGRITRKTLKLIELGGGPTVATTANWFFGKVLRPQNPGVEATGRALGYQRKWAKLDKETIALIQAAAVKQQARVKAERARKRAKAKRNGGGY